jgi:hypothetical protein
MNEFAKQMLEAGQDELDRAIEAYADALGTVDDYGDAFEALLSASNKRSIDDVTHVIDEVRFRAGDRRPPCLKFPPIDSRSLYLRSSFLKRRSTHRQKHETSSSGVNTPTPSRLPTPTRRPFLTPSTAY